MTHDARFVLWGHFPGRVHLASPNSPASWDRFFCLPKNIHHFLFLDKKKVIKEKSRLQIILGLLFFVLPTQYNSLSHFVGSLKQYCLLKATAASLKTVAIPQNNLRPFEIQNC
jgi:hypothetical protein